MTKARSSYFIRQSFEAAFEQFRREAKHNPGATFWTGDCGHACQYGQTCAACLRREIIKRFGVDVCTPQWVERDGQIVEAWTPKENRYGK